MPKVVVVGDANVDVIVPYPRFLNEERTQVEYPQIGIQGGGTSANTAVALQSLVWMYRSWAPWEMTSTGVSSCRTSRMRAWT